MPRVPGRAPVWIFALALFAGLYQVAVPTGYGFGAGWEPVAIARELAKSGEFANPFATGPSGPTAVIPPVFPFYLAGLMKLFGYTQAFALAATLTAVFVQAFHAALLPRVSQSLFGRTAPGIAAGVLSAFAFRLIPQWDATFTACGVLAFLAWSGLRTRLSAILSGLAAGLLLLTSVSSALLTVPWLIYLAWRSRTPLPRLVTACAALLLAALPWMVRNQQRLGAFVIKDNFGYTAGASNSDCSLASLNGGPASACMDQGNPNMNPAELARLKRIGEVPYDALRTAELGRWISTHRAEFARMTAARIARFWFPRVERPIYTTVTVWLATVISLAGMVLLIRQRNPAVLYLLAVSLLYPPLYYIVLIDVRYRYPMLWVSLLLAGYALAGNYSRQISSSRS